MARWSLGVDLGTSFSAGATAADGRVDVLEVGGERRLPSTVLLNEQGVLVAGRVAHRALMRYPERAERNPKRYVGRSTMLLGAVPVDVKDALAALLELFVAEGRTRFDGAAPSVVVLTCPVAWREDRRAVLSAVGHAVVPRARVVIVEEPVASALHYASMHGVSGGGNVAVYDLGGGTFDTAVLAAKGGDFDVIGEPGGDDMIGGEVFDERVYAFLGGQLERSAAEWWTEISTNPDRKYRAAAADLLDEARLAKETLSAYETASQYVGGADVDVEISRADLHALVGPDIVRTADILDETIVRAKIDKRRLSGIFLTGGASRMPLVHETLRARHGGLVRTYDDPKIVVALGAARLAWSVQEREHGGRTRPGPMTGPHPSPHPGPAPVTGPHPSPHPGPAPVTGPHPLSHPGPAPVTGPHPSPAVGPVTGPAPAFVPRPAPAPERAAGPLRPLLDDVLSVQVTPNGVYALCAGNVLRRLDLSTWRVDRELAFGMVADWSATEEGLLLAELGPAGRPGPAAPLLRTLTPELTVRSTTPLPGAAAVRTLARGAVGWAFHRTAAPVGNSHGLPWGETGSLGVVEVGLSGSLAGETAKAPLGPSAQWFVNENNGLRRLHDQDTPTGGEPALAVGSPGCVVVLGQYRGTTGLHQNAQQAFDPWQVLCLIDPGGGIRRVDRRPPNWLYQAVLHQSMWFVSTTAGLEIDVAPGPPRVVMRRSRSGALRWFPAGQEIYAVGMDGVLPSRGWSVSHCDRDTGELRVLRHEPSAALLGHLTSRERSERPRVVADGDGLWIGVTGDQAYSRILRVTPGGVTEALCERGWVEPVGAVPSGLLVLHHPETVPVPGTGAYGPGTLCLLTHCLLTPGR
ncbi:Hsp70 family protein [Microbispora sp. NPDC088329]|uniref:Hsp70 family protein n=1 Tax=Microbispora sp. NPDC088329 TaxID=3154869 RepID=UPI0034153042